jgi:putative transposase
MSIEVLFGGTRMARIARVVIPGVPHHVVQRGNRRQLTFFCDDDKKLYIVLLTRYAGRHGLLIWGYCLMDNHVHLIVVPLRKDSLRRAVGETHKAYTTIINKREGWRGFLWQGRFSSYPMDEPHLYRGMLYIERNPVRAGMVARAEDYAWSSASAHVAKALAPPLSACPMTDGIPDWAGLLVRKDSEADLRDFRLHARTGRPLGDKAFISRLEEITGRTLMAKPQGRTRRIGGK